MTLPSLANLESQQGFHWTGQGYARRSWMESQFEGWGKAATRLRASPAWGTPDAAREYAMVEDAARRWLSERASPAEFEACDLPEHIKSKIAYQDDTGCWLWLGTPNEAGYGRCGVDRKTWRVHRYTWTKLRGAIPPRMVLDHLCRNTMCCNPDHLEVVTRHENSRRLPPQVHIFRRNCELRRATHCARGHPFSGSNLGIQKGGRRYCKRCENDRKGRP